jgi:hypothetical protein
MNRNPKLIVLSALAVALLSANQITSAQNVSARGAAPGKQGDHQTVPPTSGISYVLQGTYFSGGNHASQPFMGGMQLPVDQAQTVTCPGPSTCTIQVDMWVETGDSTVSSPNGFAICAEVDGVDLSNGECFYAANTPSDTTFVTGTRSDVRGGFAPGPHVAQTFIFSNGGTPVQQYNITYRVYTP